MDTIHVIGVVAEDFKTGYSEKTKKDWSLSKYKASNGVEFSCFDHLEIGDVVVLEKNGEYWNGRKPKQSDKQHEELMNALKKTYAKLLETEKKIDQILNLKEDETLQEQIDDLD